MKKLVMVTAILLSVACQETTIEPELFGSISGLVMDDTDQPLTSAIIATIPPTAITMTDSSGQFTLEAVPEGEYTVTAEKGGYLNENTSILVNAAQATQLVVYLTKRQTPLGTLQGVLLDALTQNPIAGANITTQPPSVALLTDASGQFSVDSLPEGDYTLIAKKAGYTKDSVAVAVSPGKTTDITLLMEPKTTTIFNRPVQPLPTARSGGHTDSVTLRWGIENQLAEANLQFDVLLYTADAGGKQQVASQLADTLVTVSGLLWNTTYFWQVVAQDQHGNVTTGDVWSFTTIPFPETAYLFGQITDNNAELYAADASGQHITRLTNHPARDGYPRLSPNGQSIAFVSDRDGKQQLYTMKPDGSEVSRVTTLPLAGYHQYGEGFCWSPDGGQLLYSHYDKLYRIHHDGTNLTEVATAPANYHFKAVDWSGVNGKIIAQVVSSSINDTDFYLMNEDGSNVQPILDSVTNRLESPTFSIDGKQLLFTQDVSGFVSSTGRQLDARIFMLDLATEQVTEMSGDKAVGYNDLNPRFSPNGAQIVFEHTSNEEGTTKTVWIMDYDGQNRQLLFSEAMMPDM
ncbi:carboxypeptidase regulatory-like domain-containing protein [Tunicatimonas pelagia]|uniref:carboxypeptidase regulatory-like domain-containing protein n=1 Tax=Tunicatimonas pelagia TaxID=931531 RepID=UPI002665FA7F|nr:carboxypeptidase regulatory-like domain-containing protein [Tunicatimonas pelagia]WKN42136.1 carboxypeptidase-like regulatory domain-containing protein [Tunicatimonas pelagia]